MVAHDVVPNSNLTCTNEVIDPLRLPRTVHEYLFRNRSSQEIERGIHSLRTPPRTTFLRVSPSKNRDGEDNDVEDTAQLAKDLLRTVLARDSEQRGLPNTLAIVDVAHDTIAIQGEGPFAFVPRRKFVVIDHKCGAAVARGADVYRCGILASSADLIEGDVVALFVDVRGLVLRGATELPSLPRDSLCVGEGIALCGREVFQVPWRTLRGVGIRVTYPVWRGAALGDTSILTSDDNSNSPRLFLQNLPSIAATNALAPRASDLVLDMCAAPGNKTRHVLDLLNNDGFVIALDASFPRANDLRNTLLRDDASTSTITSSPRFAVFQCDARACVSAHNDDINNKVSQLLQTSKVVNDEPILKQVPALRTMILDDILPTRSVPRAGHENDVWRLKPKSLPRAIFDKVLLDAPCSALGQRPFLGRIDADVGHHPAVQRDLLRAASKLVRPGGTILYSTCSPCWDECEGLLDAECGTLGLTIITSERSALGKTFTIHDRTTGVPHVLDTIGFFHAVLQKTL